MFGGAYGDARMPNWPHRHYTSLPGIASPGLRRNKGGTLWGRQTFCPHFSSATGVCGWCDYTRPLFRILCLAGTLATSGCLRVRSAWFIFFLFHYCWVANANTMGGWGLALGTGWRRLWAVFATTALSPSCGALSKRQKWPTGPIRLRFSA